MLIVLNDLRQALACSIRNFLTVLIAQKQTYALGEYELSHPFALSEKLAAK